jgi:membrane-bound ClpP family serine protease
MELSTWTFILFAAGIVLLLAELFLPTHGLLGVCGGAAIVGGIACGFAINQYLGLTLLVLTAIASPFAAAGAMKIWPRTPLGRRMVLGPVESRLQPPLVRLGEVGVALSELRPMGTCQFGDERVEVRSDLGMIRPGTKVKVVNVDAGRLIVRSIEA